MTEYRLYFHKSDGHFGSAEAVEVDSDEQAIEAARSRNHAHCVEVWQSKRRVGIVVPESAEDAGPGLA